MSDLFEPLAAIDPMTLVARCALATSALVVVPLCLPLVGRIQRATGSKAEKPEVPVRLVVVLLAALGLTVALAARSGPLAALFTVPWLVVTARLALYGARRLLGRSRFRLEELAIDVALLHLPVGAAWAFAYRADLVVLGFTGTKALLTANHFHVAGFGACVLAGLVGRALPQDASTRRLAWRVAAVATTAGILTLALGIAFSRALERIAALALSAGVSVVGLLLLSLARAPGRLLGRGLLVIAGLSAVFGMHHAARYALIGFAQLDDASLRRMLLQHGLVNLVGFVLCGVLAFRLCPPPVRAISVGIPFSRLEAKGRVGPRFFEGAELVDESSGRAPVGLTEAFTEYARPGFDAGACATEVRDFYERTADHWLVVRAHWSPGFRLAGLLWHALARRLGQLAIPVRDAKQSGAVTSRIVPLRDDRDGRTSVRAWVRSYRAVSGGEGEVIYVAAYSSHVTGGIRYMNIAFPLPSSNMTSILHLSSLDRGGGVRLTTRGPCAARDGDEGVWGVTRLGAFRLPLDETIDVWATSRDAGWQERWTCPEGAASEACTVLATHDMWLLGFRYVRLVYFIGRESGS